MFFSYWTRYQDIKKLNCHLVMIYWEPKKTKGTKERTYKNTHAYMNTWYMTELAINNSAGTFSKYIVGIKGYLYGKKQNKTKPEILLHTIYRNQFQVDQRLKCERQKHKAFRIKNNIFLSSCREGFINQSRKITKWKEKLIDFITYKWRTFIHQKTP